MQRVLIIWTGFDKFKKGNPTNFRGGKAPGKPHETRENPFKNKILSNPHRHDRRARGALKIIQPRFDTG
ncbi:hypothetical protein PI86_14845 [Burkholderia sp. A9]|nr:hypothetical protein PI86_14845 [Burkholderia sp. A9]